MLIIKSCSCTILFNYYFSADNIFYLFSMFYGLWYNTCGPQDFLLFFKSGHFAILKKCNKKIRSLCNLNKNFTTFYPSIQNQIFFMPHLKVRIDHSKMKVLSFSLNIMFQTCMTSFVYCVEKKIQKNIDFKNVVAKCSFGYLWLPLSWKRTFTKRDTPQNILKNHYP